MKPGQVKGDTEQYRKKMQFQYFSYIWILKLVFRILFSLILIVRTYMIQHASVFLYYTYSILDLRTVIY